MHFCCPSSIFKRRVFINLSSKPHTARRVQKLHLMPLVICCIRRVGAQFIHRVGDCVLCAGAVYVFVPRWWWHSANGAVAAAGATCAMQPPIKTMKPMPRNGDRAFCARVQIMNLQQQQRPMCCWLRGRPCCGSQQRMGCNIQCFSAPQWPRVKFGVTFPTPYIRDSKGAHQRRLIVPVTPRDPS